MTIACIARFADGQCVAMIGGCDCDVYDIIRMAIKFYSKIKPCHHCKFLELQLEDDEAKIISLSSMLKSFIAIGSTGSKIMDFENC